MKLVKYFIFIYFFLIFSYSIYAIDEHELVPVEWVSGRLNLDTGTYSFDVELDHFVVEDKNVGANSNKFICYRSKSVCNGWFGLDYYDGAYNLGQRYTIGVDTKNYDITMNGLSITNNREEFNKSTIKVDSYNSKIYNVVSFENGQLLTYSPYYSFKDNKYYLANVDSFGFVDVLDAYITKGSEVPTMPDDMIILDYRLYSTNSYATKMSSTGSTSVRVPSSSINGSIGSTNITGQVTENNSGWTTSLEFKPTNQGSNEIKCQNNANGMVCDVIQWPTYSDTLINKPTSTNNHKYNLTVGSQNVQFNVSAHTEEGSFNSNNVVTDVAFDAILELRFNQRVSGVVKFTVSMPNSDKSENISIRLNEESLVTYNFGTLSNFPEIRFVDISNLKAVKNISVSDEAMQDLTEHGNSDSQQSESTLDGTSSNFNDVTSKFDDLESGSLDSFQNSMNDINLDDFDISNNANLSASAKWLNAQVNSVTRDNAFGALLGFSLVVGICLLIIGRIL